MVLPYAAPEVGTRDNLDLQVREEYKSYGLGVLLGYWEDWSLSHGPRF